MAAGYAQRCSKEPLVYRLRNMKLGRAPSVCTVNKGLGNTGGDIFVLSIDEEKLETSVTLLEILPELQQVLRSYLLLSPCHPSSTQGCSIVYSFRKLANPLKSSGKQHVDAKRCRIENPPRCTIS